MIHSQYTKEVVLVGPGTVASNATASASVDTLGYRYATIDAYLSPATSAATATNHRWQVLFLAQGDSTAYSSATAIATFTGTTNTVTAATALFLIDQYSVSTVASQTRLGVDLKANRGRHLFVVYQGAASVSTALVKATLSNGEQFPNTDTERGVLRSVFG